MTKDFSDKVAYGLTMSFRWFADTFFAKRYGHRAVVLETVAGVPGMVAGMWIHLKSLRKMKTGYGPDIRTLLAEAENERMHLMIFIEIAKPNWFERLLVLFAQFVFWHFYFIQITGRKTEASPPHPLVSSMARTLELPARRVVLARFNPNRI